MNDICKARTAAKVVEAFKGTDLSNIEIAIKLNTESNYISMIKNSGHYKKIPLKAWEKFRNFVNSNEKIENYHAEKIEELKTEKAEYKIPDRSIKPEVKVKIEESEGKYTLNIDIVITLNGKKITV